jgi:UDP-N-acetylmuramate: L-alanyl-gamma-D-glutamyl-meso-diaminopimelate ligase
MDKGTRVFYNSEDAEVCRVITTPDIHINATPYQTPPFHYQNGYPVMDTAKGPVNVSVFGRHNLLNMQAAIDVCMELGITEHACYNAIASFTGAARRLEKVKEEPGLLVYRDFAHAPSKLKATLNAVREAYPEHHLVAVFELHTYSSLNEKFLNEYTGSMNSADDAIVFFSHHALQLKGLPAISTETVKQYFGREDLIVSDNRQQLETLVTQKINTTEQPVFLLLMSSGTYDGIDWNNVSSQKNIL